MNNSQDTSSSSTQRTLILAGGCFWCHDAVFRQLRGVLESETGYIGGQLANPSYMQISTGTTGHAEAVKVTYNPEELPTEVLLDAFFATHNPTTLNRQGYDVGTQYRSAMFSFSDQDQADFQAAIDRVQQYWDDPVVTAIEPAAQWWPAEPEHQNFFARHPEQGYCQAIINPKLTTLRQGYVSWLREEPLG